MTVRRAKTIIRRALVACVLLITGGLTGCMTDREDRPGLFNKNKATTTQGTTPPNHTSVQQPMSPAYNNLAGHGQGQMQMQPAMNRNVMMQQPGQNVLAPGVWNPNNTPAMPNMPAQYVQQPMVLQQPPVMSQGQMMQPYMVMQPGNTGAMPIQHQTNQPMQNLQMPMQQLQPSYPMTIQPGTLDLSLPTSQRPLTQTVPPTVIQHPGVNSDMSGNLEMNGQRLPDLNLSSPQPNAKSAGSVQQTGATTQAQPSGPSLPSLEGMQSTGTGSPAAVKVIAEYPSRGRSAATTQTATPQLDPIPAPIIYPNP